MSEPGQNITKEDLDELILKYREVKHTVNNHIAVMMALAELSQQNPQHTEKLIKAALERSPQIVNTMQNFQRELTAKRGDVKPAAQ